MLLKLLMRLAALLPPGNDNPPFCDPLLAVTGVGFNRESSCSCETFEPPKCDPLEEDEDIDRGSGSNPNRGAGLEAKNKSARPLLAAAGIVLAKDGPASAVFGCDDSAADTLATATNRVLL